MFKTSRNRNSVKIVLDFTGFLRLLGNNSVIPLLTAAKKAPFLSPETARTAGRSGRPDAEKRQAFLLLRRLRLLPLLKSARRRSSSAFAISATLPHGDATSGLRASGGYTLGCAAKVAQTANTGATGWDWRFGCAFNRCFQ
jgi:hypothetical protein